MTNATRLTEEQIEKASDWWSEQLRSPSFDNGDDSNMGEMCHMMATMAQCDIPDAKIDKFKSDSITKFKLKSGKRAIYIPIKIAEHNLGDMLLIMEGNTLPLFKGIMSDFENYFLDDQLYHVLNSVSRKQVEKGN